jgi:hypothetical protein
MLLICSAIDEETFTLRAFLAKGRQERKGFSGRLASRRLRLCSLGIGAIEATLALVEVLQEEAFEAVYFIGTAGILPGTSFEISQAVAVSEVQAGPAPGQRLPGPLADILPVPLTSSSEACRVWAPLGVNESLSLAEDAARRGAAVENLEAALEQFRSVAGELEENVA